jgi:hypothetical protein
MILATRCDRRFILSCRDKFTTSGIPSTGTEIGYSEPMAGVGFRPGLQLLSWELFSFPGHQRSRLPSQITIKRSTRLYHLRGDGVQEQPKLNVGLLLFDLIIKRLHPNTIRLNYFFFALELQWVAWYKRSTRA